MEILLEVKKTKLSDWDIVKKAKYTKQNVISFRKQAKKISLKKDIYEVSVEARGDDDPIIQEWYQNGKLHFKMF